VRVRPTGIQIDYHKGTLSANGTTLNRGDYISIDGTAGEVFAGEVATGAVGDYSGARGRLARSEESVTYQEYAKLMKWADEFRALGVRANADTPAQVKNAVAFGAEGIGLCRTEHMFFEGDRIDAMRGDDSRRTPRRARASTGETAPVSARRFYRHLYGAKWFAWHDSLSRSPAARVSARRSRAAKRIGEQAWGSRGTNFAPRA